MNTKEIREATVWELVDGTLMMSLPKDKVIALCDAADGNEELLVRVAYEAHMLGRIYNKNGEKESPSDVCARLHWMIVADDGHCRGLYSAQDKDHAEAAIYRDKELFPDSRLAPLFTTPPDTEARTLLMWAQYMTVHVIESADISREVKKDAADLNRQITAHLAQTDAEGE